MEKIYSFFAPQKFSDPKETREAKFAYYVSLSMLCGFACSYIYSLIIPAKNPFIPYLYFSYSIISIILFSLNQKKHLKSPLLSTTIVCLAAMFTFMFFAEGTHDEMVNVMPVVLIIVSLAYNKKSLLLSIIISICIIWTVGLLEINGLLIHKYSFGTTYFQLVLQSFILIITGLLIDLLVGDLKAFNKEVKRKSDELKTANDELKNSNNTKDKLLSVIAHDLQSPFQGFIGITEEMSNNLDSFSKEELLAITKKINSNARNLFDLLKNMLEWSRLKKGEYELDIEKIELKSFVDGIKLLVEQYALSKRISIFTKITEGSFVLADRKMLSSVLINLITNSIKFTMPEGKITITSKTEVEDYIQISVTDSGIGIPEELSSRLFKIEEKVGRRGTSGEPSTGLGLILCKEFIEKNSGKIWLERWENEGTTFTFTLPKVDS